MKKNSLLFTDKVYPLKSFRYSKTVLFSFYVLLVLLFIALLAPFLATEKPWYVSYKGYSLFPAFSLKNHMIIPDNGNQEKLIYELTDWKKLKCDQIIFAPVPYSPSKTDYANADYVSPSGSQFFTVENGEVVNMPGRFRHILGTDKLGRDVLAGLIHGTRISLIVGIFSMAIAAVIGIILGAAAGYLGNNDLKISRGKCWALAAGIVVAYFYAFENRFFSLKDALQDSTLTFLFQLTLSLVIFIFIVIVFFYGGKLLNPIPFFKKQVSVPVDYIVNLKIEVITSLPVLILVITIAAIAKPSLLNLILIIGLISWTDIARLTRAEFMKLRNIEFIEASRALGYSRRRIILFHALPNGIAPALVAITFGITGAILIESSLSFLGIGVQQDVITWGTLLAGGKENFDAWWMVIFPGLALFITVMVFNILGDGVRDALDPKKASHV